jgi:serine/threonine protein kinase
VVRRHSVPHDDTAGPGGRFSLLRPVGANAFASLWEGEDSANGDAVLIEVVRGAPPAEPGEAQVLREHMAAAQHAPVHPGLLAVREVYAPSEGTAAREDGPVNWGRWLLVLEPFDGSTFYQRAVFGGLTSEAICAIAAKVGEAIGALHEVGIAHGSLSPTSVLVSNEGDVRVIDAIVGSWLSDLGSRRGHGRVEHDLRRDDLAALARLVTERVPPDEVPPRVRWLLASRDEPTLDELVQAFRGAEASTSSAGNVVEHEPRSGRTRPGTDEGAPVPGTASSDDDAGDRYIVEEERLTDGEAVRRADHPQQSTEPLRQIEHRSTGTATTSLQDDAVAEEDRSVVVFVPEAVDDEVPDEGSPSPTDEQRANDARAVSTASDEGRWSTSTAAPAREEADPWLALHAPSVVPSPGRLPPRPSDVAPSASPRAPAARQAAPETEPTWWMTAAAVVASLVMFGAIGAAIYYVLLNP